MAEFDDEVDEELRRARLKAAWDRYGNYGIGSVVAILLTVAGWSTYDSIVSTERNQLGQVLLRGDGAERSEQVDNAIAAYKHLRENGSGSGYDLIAAFREASLLGQLGQLEEQRAVYDHILAQEGLSEPWREAALFYKAWSQLEELEPEALREQLQPFLVEDNVYYPNALEALVLSYITTNQLDLALEYAEKLSDYAEIEGNGGGLFDYVGFIKGGKPVALDRETIDKMGQDKREAREAQIEAQKKASDQRMEARKLVDERVFQDVDSESAQLYHEAEASGAFADAVNDDTSKE